MGQRWPSNTRTQLDNPNTTPRDQIVLEGVAELFMEMKRLEYEIYAYCLSRYA